MALQYLFDPNKQFQSTGGVNEVGGFLRVFFNGTDDRATTYRNFDGGLNEPDIVLDTYGRAVVIVDDTKTYRIEVYNRLGGLMWTVKNYKASGGSGGGSGTPVSVEGTVGEIDVDENTEGGVKHFVIGLASTIKNAIATLTMAVNGVANALNGKKDKQTPVNESSATTKTLVGISQDEDGVMTPEFDDIAFPDYSQRFEDIENEQAVDAKVIAAALNDLDARLAAIESEGDNIGDVTADSLDAQNLYVGGVKVKFQQAAMSIDGATDKTVTNISQDENGVITVTYSAIAFPDWTSAINAAVAVCEKTANKKNTLVGYETSTTAYPSIKAVVDFVHGMLQNLGGKLITDNGDPFTDSSDLPSTTPYGGVDIADKDYAYIQNTGTAERWSATVSGSSVTWQQEYAISIPVFTPAQQAAIDSGATSTKVGNYDSHISNTSNPHNVTAAQIGAVRYDTASQGLSGTQKQNARTNIGAGTYSVPSGGIPKTDLESGVQSSLDKADSALQNHQSVVNSAPTLSWGNTSTVGSVGGIALTVKMPSNPATGKLDTNGDGSDVTASFTTAGSRNNISTGEKLSVIFGKIAKWFGDLKAVAFSGSYNDLSDKPTIPTVNNGKLTIYRNGTALGSFSANQSSLLGIDIIVPTKTSDLNNDSSFLTESGNGSNVTSTFSEASSRSNISSGESLSTIFGKIKKFFSDLKSVAFTGNYSDLSGKPTIPAAANNGVLTIKQNGTSKGTFSANQSSNTEINVTDTTYESKNAESGGTAVSLVTTGDKYNWNRKQSALPIALSNPLRYDIQVVFAYNSTNASYSAKIGNATDHPQIGGNDVPTYVNDGGNVVEGWRTPNIKCAYANITSSNALALIHNVQGAKGTLILDPFRILCRIDSDKIIIYVYAPVTTSESWNNAVLDGCIQWVLTTSGNTESYVEEIDGRIPQDSSRTMVLGSANISATFKQKMQANITMRVRRSDLNVNCKFMVNASFSIIKSAGTSDNAYVYAYSNMILF